MITSQSSASDHLTHFSEVPNTISYLEHKKEMILPTTTLDRKDKHTEDFINKFNDLPPAVKLSFLVHTFKKNHNK